MIGMRETGIHFELDEGYIQQVIQAMRGLEKSEESVFKTAINNTASRAQKLLARQAKRVYGGEAPQGILERSSIRKSTVSDLGATIFFRSEQPDIMKFRVSASGQEPTPIAWEDGQRVKFPISIQQLKGRDLKELSGVDGMAFAIRFKNGKLAIVTRTGKKTYGGNGKDELKVFMGSSDRSMIQNERVYGKVEGKIADILNQQCQRALEKALAGGSR